MQEIVDTLRDGWQVVGRGTSEEGLQRINNPSTVTGLFPTFAAADAAAKAAVGSPDNWYETQVLGPGPTYRD